MMPVPQVLWGHSHPFDSRGGERAVPDDDAPELPLGIDPGGVAADLPWDAGAFGRRGGNALAVAGAREPASGAIAGDPLLVEGRETSLARCVSCHGESAEGTADRQRAAGLRSAT